MFLEAIDEMRHMIFIEMDDGYEPCNNFYVDISKETFKFSGIWLAFSICMGSSAPTFFFALDIWIHASWQCKCPGKFTKGYGCLFCNKKIL